MYVKSDNKSMTINFQKLHFPNVVQFSGNFIEMVSVRHCMGWDDENGMRTPKFFDRIYINYMYAMHVCVCECVSVEW